MGTKSEKAKEAKEAKEAEEAEEAEKVEIKIVQRAQRPMPMFVFGRSEGTLRLRITITEDEKTP